MSSAFLDKKSPLCRSRSRNDEKRIEDLRIASIETKIKWHIGFLLANTLDFIIFNSQILSFFLFCHAFPQDITSKISSILSIYFGVIIMFLLIDMKFPGKLVFDYSWKNLMANNTTNGKVSAEVKKPSIPSPNFDDNSWLDAHQFGTPNENLRVKSNTSIRGNSPNSNTSLDISADWRSPARTTESIHTRKQLDVLLRSHRNDAQIDLNSTNNSTYFSNIWHNSFDGGKSPNQLNNSYQLSEELKEDQANSPYKIKIGKNGLTEVTMRRRRTENDVIEDDENDDELTKLHKIMNAAKNSPSAADAKNSSILKRSNSTERGRSGSLRRRSHSSPDRSMDYYGGDSERYRTGELLTEEQQRRAEFRVRAWLRNTIILPLAEQIEEINKVLEKEHPTVRIGQSSIDALKLAIIEKDILKSTNLPFVLPFLSTCTANQQAYLVSRIRELASNEFMDVYKWNGGGMEPAEDKLNTSRLVRREWNDSLPTDSILIFDLFCIYMDAQLNSNCLVGDHRLDQPFTSRFVVKSPKKPVAAQRAPYMFYLHMSSQSPPNFELIHNDSTGTSIKCQISRQSSNLFRAIAQFVHYAKEEHNGYIDRTNIGPSGINILCVLY
ncbi:unnamed protein product [Caenorhabditis angaria]|uniref:Uncharacterized protein n=1 Tax=Caenorhabditis angaria TaxID=860376 RepID=A0A9P1IHP2_9PELO|nr:unnamed protein product [Caenorhabditis angaria]